MNATAHNFCSRRSTAPVNRWLITGAFTTLTELRIGDGNTGEVSDRSRPAAKTGDRKTTQHDVDTVMVDKDGRAFIPGSSIKGPLRSLVRDKKTGFEKGGVWESLLGSDKAETGGKLLFFDARLDCQQGGCDPNLARWRTPRSSDDLLSDRTHPWWDPIRRTCVAASHRRDRRTNTVEDQFLYHTEYVPAGEKFTFEIGAANLTDNEAGALLGLLKALVNAGDLPPLHLGARDSKDWGRVKWEITSARCLDASAIQKWLKDQNPAAGFAACETFGTDQWPAAEALTLTSDEQIVFDLVLDLQSPWLVGDARQGERGDQYKHPGKYNFGTIDGAKPADAVGMVDERGRPMSPAKSVAGALRGRAEWILRSLGLPCAGLNEPLKGKNWEEQKAHLLERGLADLLFGCSGWQAPVKVSRATVENNPGTAPQDFVAVDRFTGGAAEHLKFNAEPAKQCRLKARIEVDRGRLHTVGELSEALALLAFVFRDLRDGWIPIGRKSSIGYGEVRLDTGQSTVTGIGDGSTRLSEWFKSEDLKTHLKAFDTYAIQSAQIQEAAHG